MHITCAPFDEVECGLDVFHDDLCTEEDHELYTVFELEQEELTNAKPQLKLTFEEMFAEVHNSKAGHWGVRETWKQLNKIFPGHGTSMALIAEKISLCPNCQKNRKERRDKLISVVRSLKPPHSRSASNWS